MPDHHDSAEAVAFLTRLHPDIPVQIVAMSPDGRPSAQSFEPRPARGNACPYREAPGHAQHLLLGKPTAGPLRPAKKAKKADVVSSHCLHVDVDDVLALESILNARIPPTAVIFSGGGYQAFYRLTADEIDLDRIGALQRGARGRARWG